MPPERHDREYILGDSAREQERLRLQASIVGGWTEGFFKAAGIDRGMNVLDLGCGAGDVSLLASEMVGPSGSVTGIDKDPAVIEKARERCHAQGHSAPIDLIHGDLMEFYSEHRHFDAVVGRYILLYQPDPVAAIQHVLKSVRSGGIVCFHEMDFANPIRGFPGDTLFAKSFALVGETFARAGLRGDFGLHLTTTFMQAGLPWPQLKAEVPIGGEAGSYLYIWLIETLRSLLPRMESLGVTTAAELDLDTLAERIEAESTTFHAELFGPLQVGAWSRKVA
jgi:ubiquinone/menaquinone biosynthesis C-methylase UbiE